jgi:hypothetical protein
MLGLTVIDMIPETNIKKIHGKHICKCQMNTPEQLLYAKNKKKNNVGSSLYVISKKCQIDQNIDMKY